MWFQAKFFLILVALLFRPVADPGWSLTDSYFGGFGKIGRLKVLTDFLVEKIFCPPLHQQNLDPPLPMYDLNHM
jgi:hypothetical protein